MAYSPNSTKFFLFPSFPQHMAAYSPISSRNHRINTAQPYHISSGCVLTTSGNALSHTPTAGHTSLNNRRRESVNSSIGANSIRRLLTVNRGCRHKIPIHIRAKVAKNFTFLILAHGLAAAVLIPLFGLQVTIIIHSVGILTKFD